MMRQAVSVFSIGALISLICIASLSAQSGESVTKRPTFFSAGIKQEPPEDIIIENANEPLLFITCNEDSADVYIDNIFYGTTPITRQVLLPGFHSIRIEKKYFYPRLFEIDLTENKALHVDVKLHHTEGIVHINPEPADALILIDNETVFTGTHTIETGSHRIEIKKFGYTPWTETITVAEDMSYAVTPILQPATFELSDFSTSRKHFNPDTTSALGLTTFSFFASSYGTAKIDITKKDSTDILWTYTFPRFSTWEQSVIWDGHDCPDGEYTATLIPIADNIGSSIGTQPAKVEITIDRTLRTPVLSYSTGIGSVGKIPSACMLPHQICQFEFLAGKTLQVRGIADEPWQGTIAMAGTPLQWMELAGSAAVLFDAGIVPAVHLNAGVKIGHHIKDFYFAGFFCGGYTDDFTITVGVPLEYARTQFSILVTPQITYSANELGGKIGTALRIETGIVSTGIWGALSFNDASELTEITKYAAGIHLDITIGDSGSIIVIENEWTGYNTNDITTAMQIGYKALL